MKYILKQILYAFTVAAIVLAIYLAAVNVKKPDDIVGKYAYSSKNGNYLGKVKGRGRSTKAQGTVYYIEEPTGSLIQLPVEYVEVRDKSPYER